MYPYNDLFLFIKIIEVGSFSGAAKLLKLSQSTISRKMHDLEKSLDAVLFKQHNKGFELTAIGKTLFEDFKKKRETIDELINLRTKHKPLAQGTIKISLPPVLALSLITPHLPDFLEKYPDINLHICYQITKVNLIKNGFDFAIETVNHTKSQHKMLQQTILSSEYRLYCSKKYKEKYGIPKKPLDLQNHLVTGVMLEDKTIAPTNEFIHRKTGAITSISINGFATNNAMHNLEMLDSDEAIIGLFDYIKIPNPDNIVQVLPDYFMGHAKYYMVTHPFQNNFITDLFCNFIKEILVSKNTDSLKASSKHM